MQADVVVIGGGGSGLAAAISAASEGANVVLLEKDIKLGGTTGWSIGTISATRTVNQKRAGIVDTPQAHYEDMALFSKKYTTRPDNDALRRVMAEHIPETADWLSDCGVEFFGPIEEPPHRQPRMHNALPGARAYIFHMQRRAEKLGVRIITGAAASRLITTNERVTGVAFDTTRANNQIAYAKRGVVIASGDYSASAAMKQQFISQAVADTEAVNRANTGDGQRMALELGARLINEDIYMGGLRFVPPAKPAWVTRLPPWRWLMRATNIALRHGPQAVVRGFVMSFLTTVLVPSAKLFASGAILINSKGERFADESQKLVAELPYQPGAYAYIVFDHALAENFSKHPNEISTAPGFAYAYLADYQKNRPDLFHQGDTPQALAAKLGIDAAVLTATIAGYNQPGAARGQRPALNTGPYYALGPVKNYINFTDGGLAVNETLQVLDAKDQPIPGLYAAGSAGQGGLLLKGHGHHLIWAFTSGRLAGRYASRDALVAGSAAP